MTPGPSSRAAHIVLLALSLAPALLAQETRFASDLRREREALSSCGQLNLGGISGCAETLFTGQPFHVAVGSIAPQNGVAFGLAFVEHKDLQNEWRLNWNVDAVASGNASWRAGAYMKAYRLPGGNIVVHHPGANASSGSTAPLFRVAPLFQFHAETTALNRLYFYGLGPNTPASARSVFGLTETIAGAHATVPLGTPLGLGIVAELNGRFPTLRGNHGESSPSVEQLYSAASAPGLDHQPSFLQASEGLRLQPTLPHDLLRLNYLVQFQQFVPPKDAVYSFRRLNVDLNHEIPLYRNVRLTSANPHNGPDSCASSSSPSDPRPCPHISTSQNLEGSINVRLLITASTAKSGSIVPFYLQPTLGGSDINGTPFLASYPDFRFRAPNLLLLRGTIEHSIGKLPIGALFSIDEGKVAMRRDDIAFNHLRHTFTAGLTVHAGGLPVVSLLFAWGGSEGHHTTATVSNALLGASPRPSLF